MISISHNNQWAAVVKFGLTGLFALWLGASIVQFVQLLLGSEQAQAPETLTQQLNTSSQNARPDIDIRSLLDTALFPEVNTTIVEQPEPEPVEEETLVETQLNLRLKGLFAAVTSGGGQAEAGQAIIANGAKEKLYQVNQEIEGLSGVKLLAVYSDRVKLDNRGNAEVLYLYAPGERLQPSQVSVGSDDLVPATVNAPLKATKKLNEIMRVISQKDTTTGEMIGFRVQPGRDRKAFNRSGLKINDVITTIDGDQLTDIKAARDIYRKKRNATQVSLIIQRDGSELSLDIDLTELSDNDS